MNSGYLGYPLVLFAFGDSALSMAVIYNLMNGILIFSLGIYIISQGKDRWQLFKIPFLYTAIAGMLISITGTKIPNMLYSPLHFIGQTTIPLALFMLGYRLAYLKVAFWKLSLFASILRIGLGLGLGILAAYIFKLEAVTAKIVILLSSLGSGITPIALCEEYDNNPDLVASTIALSTLLSVISVMLILNWLL